MITGFNNDIKHRGTVFHIQTEDKGEESAWIESLIYVGGRILARKRATYKQLLEEGGSKRAIAKLMERQHRLMIQQIRDGRFDAETADGERPAAASEPEVSREEIATARMKQQADVFFGVDEETVEEAVESAEAEVEPEPVEQETPVEATLDEPLLPTPTPSEAGAPSLDQVIFDYLASVAAEESLVLLMDESPALASATTSRIDLGTHASRSGKPVADAHVAVRMISKMMSPVTLAEGTTDDNGTLELLVEVPPVPENSAALIISATSPIGKAEIKHLL